MVSEKTVAANGSVSVRKCNKPAIGPLSIDAVRRGERQVKLLVADGGGKEDGGAPVIVDRAR
jgi:hypothetical protein